MFRFPFKRPPSQQWLRIPDLSLRRVPPPPQTPRIFTGSIYFPFIAARSSSSADLELKFPKRGRHVQEGLGISTRFPFSFLTKTRRVALQRELVVYPSVDPTEDFFDVLPLIAGEFEAFVRGRGYDLYRIREYLPEDSARNVDWKATAKTGALKVREFTREDESKLRIIFDNPAQGTVSEKAYESGVQMAASLAWHFSQQDAELNFLGTGWIRATMSMISSLTLRWSRRRKRQRTFCISFPHLTPTTSSLTAQPARKPADRAVGEVVFSLHRRIVSRKGARFRC